MLNLFEKKMFEEDLTFNQKRLMKKLLFQILFLFLLSSGFSQAYREVDLHSISRKEGLSNGAVNAISSDNEGFMWFGTWNGLNRYDGSSFVSYMPGAAPNLINNHVVRKIFTMSDGEMWMLTNRGISRYNNKTGAFTSYFANESDQTNYENDIDLSANNSDIWVSVFGKGVYQYNRKVGKFELLSVSEISGKRLEETRMICSVGNDLFLVSQKGDILSIDHGSILSIGVVQNTSIITSLKGYRQDGVVYLTLTHRDDLATMVNVNTRAMQRLSLPNDAISTFGSLDKHGLVWVGTEKGAIWKLDLKTGEMLSPDFVLTNKITTRILSIYESKPDLLWIGTDGGGLFNLRLSPFPITKITAEQLAYPIVRTILVARNGDVLVGTKGGGIDIFSSLLKYKRSITIDNGLSNNSVLSLYQRKDGSIWVGTDGSGVDIVSEDYLVVKSFPYDFQTQRSVDFGSVYRILEDSEERIFLGTSGHGVILLEFGNGSFQYPISYEQLILDSYKGVKSRQRQIVYALTEERPGVIWIGTRGLGLFRYNTITKRVMNQVSMLTHKKEVSNDDVLTLHKGPQERIWVGTSGGMYSVLPISDRRVEVFPMSKSASPGNGVVNTIQSDRKGNLWITGSQGLMMFDKDLQVARRFNPSDGLINYEYSDGAAYFDKRNNRLYAGGTLGVDIVNVDQLTFSDYFPPIALTQILVRDGNNENIRVTSDGFVENFTNKLNLSHNQNALNFRVTPLVYWSKDRYKIGYRLLNYSSRWEEISADQPILFSNLPPGKFILQLRVSDENGRWSDVQKEVEIIITPPFWLTSWAIILYVILLVLIQWLIIKMHRRREAKKKEAAMLEFKLKKEEELQSYKIEFFTNIAHEFRTPLTLITSHIHLLLEDERSAPVKSKLHKIYNNTVKLQRLILEIIQFRKLEKGKEQLVTDKCNPVILIKEVVSDLELPAQEKGVKIVLDDLDAPPEIIIDADKFQRIVMNLLSNAIKYNKTDGEVFIKITKSDSGFDLLVKDSGMGIEPSLLPKIFEPFGISSERRRGGSPTYRSSGLGLAVTKSLANLLKAQIEVTSTLGEGTTFLCQFINLPLVEIRPTLPAEESPADFLPEIGERDVVGSEIGDLPYRSKILVVDDDPEILDLMKDLLQTEYELSFAQNGKEALERLRAQSVDLVISDVMMPEMDGIELFKAIRSDFNLSHLPLILLTAKAEIEDRIVGIKAGADSYIPKPFHPDHLKTRIETLILLRQQIRERYTAREDNRDLIKGVQDPFFTSILTFIDENLDDQSLSAEKLCQYLAISKSALYTKTKTLLNITPHGLINQRRLNKAVKLLQTTTLNVSEIIDQTGFNSRAHFYELFNKVYSCSPTEFRQNGNSERRQE